MSNKLRFLPSTIMAVLLIVGLSYAVRPSAHQDIFIYSYFRFSFIVAIVAALLYTLVSLTRPRLVLINNWALYGLVSALVMTEVALRVFSFHLPMGLVRYLPAPARSAIAGDRGFFTEDVITGDGLLYHFKPGIRIPELPWLTIDARGYRNEEIPEGGVDVVFLGDSVTIAQAAEHDFSFRFRAHGLSTLNLGMNGYGAFHYRDVLRRYLVDAALRARYLVVVVTGYNDLHDTLNYVWTKEKGGDYRSYLGILPTFAFGNFQSRYVPWVISLLGNTAPLIKAFFEARLAGPGVRVELPYAELEVERGILRRDPIGEEDLIWRHFRTAVTEILDIAAANGMKTLVAYYPPSRMILRPYLHGNDEFVTSIREDHDSLMAMLHDLVARPNVRFADLTDFTATAASYQLITLDPLNYHLNTVGVDLVAGRLLEELERLESGEL